MKPILQNRRQFLGTLSLASAALAVPGIGRVSAAEGHFEGTKVSVPKWWRDQYRILQTNLREIDALEDPREIARAVREFGATALVTNIGGIVAFYPTQLELQYTNPYLKGDFAGEMIEAARAEGLTVLGRFDLSKTTSKAYEAHPDWFMRTREGKPIISEGAYHACPNGDWAQKYSFEIMGEAVPKYIADGYFFNMTGYRTTNYQGVKHSICVCENCQRRFRDMYGLALPKTDGFGDPHWTTYLEFQDRTVDELNRKVRQFIDQFTDAPILAFRDFVTVGRGEVQRRFYRPREWAYQSGDQVRWALARNPGRSFSATSTAHIDYPWRQATETAACHLLRFAQQLGTGAHLDLYLMGSIKDQDDPSYLPPVSKLFKWHEAHKPFYAGLEPAAKVALYSSYNNDRYGDLKGGFGAGYDAYRGAYKALVDARIPFWMVNDLRIADGTTDLDAYDVIVMPDIKLVSDAEIAALDKFVKNGGTLLVTGQTGVFDERGKRRASIGFRSFPGSAYGEPVDARGWSANLDTAKVAIGQGRMVIDGNYYPMELRQGAASLMSLAPYQRFGPPEFTYAIPGVKAGSEPVVLERKYGKGAVIQIPWSPDALYYQQGLVNHRDLLAVLVERHAPPPRYRLEGAGPVELMVMHQPSTGKDLIHVVNYAGQRDGLYEMPPAIAGMKLGVRKSKASAFELIGDTSLNGTTREGYTWFELPPIETFTAISLS